MDTVYIQVVADTMFLYQFPENTLHALYMGKEESQHRALCHSDRKRKGVGGPGLDAVYPTVICCCVC